MPPRRCHWYYDNGQPRRQSSGILGCNRKNCTFVHPSDPAWSMAPSSGPPPPGSTIETSERDIASLPRRPSSPSRLPSIARRERSDDAERLYSRRPSDSQNRSRPTSPSRFQSLSHASRQPSSSSTRPAASTSMLPPSTAPKMSKVESSSNEKSKLAAWVERIKLLAEVVSLRTEHLDMQRELQKYQRLLSLPRFSDVDSEDRTNFKGHISSLEGACTAKKEELNATVKRLVDTDFWPVTSSPAPNLSATIVEIQSNIQELKDNMKELHSMLSVAVPKAVTVPPGVKVEPLDDAVRPAKRRRLSMESAAPISPSSGVPAPSSRHVTPHDERDALKEQVIKLEDRLTELENEMVQHENTLFMEVEESISLKFEDMRLAPQPIPPSVPSASAEGAGGLILPVSQKLVDLEEGLNKTGDEVGVLIEEVAGLIMASNDTQADLHVLREENAQLKEQLIVLQHAQEESRKAIEKNQAEIESLTATVQAYLARSNQTSPPSSEEIISSLYPSILQAVKQDLKPIITQVHDDIQEMLQTHSQEISSTLVEKLSVTLQTVESFSAYVENKPNGVNGINGVPKPLQSKQPAG